MEKEQAIDLLDNLIGMIEDNQGNDYDTAFRMGIDALKQPEIVTCSECGLYYTVPSGRRRCSLHCTYTQPDDFCSRAERRTDG